MGDRGIGTDLGFFISGEGGGFGRSFWENACSTVLFTKNDHTNNTISNASLCAAAAEKPRKDSLSLSLSQRKGDVVFFRSLWSLSRIFSSISKSFIKRTPRSLLLSFALFCSLSLSLFHTHTHTQTAASCEDETMICDTALLFAHSSEFSVRTKKESAKRRHMSFNFCLKTPKIE